MVWFFEREGKYVRIETRLGEDPGAFELVVTEPGAAERLERFNDERTLLARYEAICRELAQSGWGAPASWRV